MKKSKINKHKITIGPATLWGSFGRPLLRIMSPSHVVICVNKAYILDCFAIQAPVWSFKERNQDVNS